jgi:1-acyl-sn-glycerol-3-phosphate acyltransferase
MDHRMHLLSSIHLDPEFSSNRFFRFAFRMAKLLLHIQVGKIEIYGSENLYSADAPIMICSNHSHYVDAAILGVVLKHPAHYMAHSDVFRKGLGLGKFIFRKLGAFSAGDGTCSSAQHACKTAVNALTAGETLVIQPEGRISFAPKIFRFRSGAVRIINEASNQLGKSVSIVPAFIKYGRYPGRWIHFTENSSWQGFLLLFGFFYYRRGATVIFGRPISSAELPGNNRIASSFLLSKVAELGDITFENVCDASIVSAEL